MHTITGNAKFNVPLQGNGRVASIIFKTENGDYTLGQRWNLNETDLTNATAIKVEHLNGSLELKINHCVKEEDSLKFFGAATWIGLLDINVGGSFHIWLKNPKVKVGPYLIPGERPVPLAEYEVRARCFQFLFRADLERTNPTVNIRPLLEITKEIASEYNRLTEEIRAANSRRTDWASKFRKQYQKLAIQIEVDHAEQNPYRPDPMTLEIIDQWLINHKGITLTSLPSLL